jgi:uncharacterized membrane protein YgaE (UPF0421/DUF939 family)
VRLDGVMAIQAGAAAGLAWFVAVDLLHHVRPFFAPVSAVIVLGAAAGKRWRRAMEMVIGVALGIAVGDALIAVIGVGATQVGAVVALAMLTSIVLGGTSVTAGQAAASAVLVATIAPPSGGIYYSRFLDALIGGVIGLLVMAVIPFNPLARVRQQADVSLTVLSDALSAGAEALERRDQEQAEQALDELRRADADYLKLRDTLTIGQETAALSPLRWSHRSALMRYVEAAVYIDRTTRNVRVLLRRTAFVLRNHEPVPADLPRSLRRLSAAVAMLRQELAEETEPVRTRDLALEAVHEAWSAYADGVDFSGSVVVAQIRSAVADILAASGLAADEVEAILREAATPRGRDRR